MKHLSEILKLEDYTLAYMPQGMIFKGETVRLSKKSDPKDCYIEYNTISDNPLEVDEGIMYELYLDRSYLGAFHDIRDCFKMIEYFVGGRFITK